MDEGNSTTWHGPCKRSVLATKFRAYEPNSKMIVSTFEEDLLGLKEFANRLDKFIATEQKFVEGSLVIALSAKFGFGKTTFLQMWSSSLKKAEEDGNKPFVISLNAWESDYYGDPLFAIISELVDCIQKEEGKESAKELKEAAKNLSKDLSWFTTAIAGQILKKMSGIDPLAAGKFALEKKEKRDHELKVLPDTFSIYQDRKESMHKLKLALQGFVEGSERKILFLVDELDRCRPDYAIDYLETIKHIFDVNGAVFILAADRRQLKNSAKKAFGANLDFEEYYRKFIHREVSLPEISDEHYEKLVTKYIDIYLEGEGLRRSLIKLNYDRRKEISRLVRTLKLTPRQIQEVFRILGHVCEAAEDKQGHLFWQLAAGSILMAALKIGESKIYHLLGNQALEPQEAFEFFKNLLGEDFFGWWFEFILTGGGLKMGKDDTQNEIMRNVGLPDRDLSGWHAGWLQLGYDGSGPSRFIKIHEKIEQISQWD